VGPTTVGSGGTLMWHLATTSYGGMCQHIQQNLSALIPTPFFSKDSFYFL
jgi:hypothetical protein